MTAAKDVANATNVTNASALLAAFGLVVTEAVSKTDTVPYPPHMRNQDSDSDYDDWGVNAASAGGSSGAAGVLEIFAICFAVFLVCAVTTGVRELSSALASQLSFSVSGRISQLHFSSVFLD